MGERIAGEDGVGEVRKGFEEEDGCGEVTVSAVDGGAGEGVVAVMGERFAANFDGKNPPLDENRVPVQV